eukprot:11196177-Lingulodinium_polyedra.AAC.1
MPYGDSARAPLQRVLVYADVCAERAVAVAIAGVTTFACCPLSLTQRVLWWSPWLCLWTRRQCPRRRWVEYSGAHCTRARTAAGRCWVCTFVARACPRMRFGGGLAKSCCAYALFRDMRGVST